METTPVPKTVSLAPDLVSTQRPFIKNPEPDPGPGPTQPQRLPLLYPSLRVTFSRSFFSPFPLNGGPWDPEQQAWPGGRASRTRFGGPERATRVRGVGGAELGRPKGARPGRAGQGTCARSNPCAQLPGGITLPLP